jgi:LacI family transcriptional regulator
MEAFKDRVTIYEVAKRANVSLATVSRVINNKGNVTEETSEKVKKIIKELNFQPSGLARSLATNKTTSIGVLLPSINFLYLTSILAGLIDVGRIYGYNISIFPVDTNEPGRAVSEILSSHCDGIVIFGTRIAEDSKSTIVDFNIPTVFIGDTFTSEKIGSVSIDYFKSLKGIVKNYLSKGIHEIAVIKYDDPSMYFLDDINPFIEEIYKNEKTETVQYIVIKNSYKQTYNQFLEIFKSGAYPKVIIAPRDSIAAGVLNAALDSHIKVPEDLEIISAISTKYSIITRPEISSISTDMYQIGSVSARMVTKILENKLKDKSYKIPTEYIPRGTTK